MLKTRQVILAKTEVTYNTDPTPTAGSNAILVENLSHNFTAARRAERKVVKGTFAPIKDLYAGALVEISFDCEIKGSGAAGTAPEIGPLLTACAMAETVVAATSVTYKPTSTASNHKSLTFYIYEDGLRYKVTGARGSFSINLQTASKGVISFKFTGHYNTPTDTSIVSPTYNPTVPPVLVSVPFSIDSYSAVISKLGIDLGIQIATPDNIAASDGYGTIVQTGRSATFTMDPEATLVATYDWITKWQSSGGYALTTGVIGGTAGNIYTISAPVAVYGEIGNGDRSNVLTREIKGMLVESTTDDELSLAFT